MTAASTTSVTGQLSAAALAVAQSWGLGDAFVIGEPSGSAPELSFTGQAVIVEFSGAVSGQLALMVDAEIAQQLMESPAAPEDLVAALTPSTTAAALALGNVTIESSRTLDLAAAREQIMRMADAAFITLSDDDDVRVILAVGQRTEAEPAETIPAQPRATSAGAALPHTDRLDLIRGVQMQATVELGRTSMTINELLALRSGAVIELDRAAGAPADLYVNGRLIAHGEVVVVDENYGLRILRVVADEVS